MESTCLGLRGGYWGRIMLVESWRSGIGYVCGRLVVWYCVLYVVFFIIVHTWVGSDCSVYDLQYNLQCGHSCDGLKAVEKPTVLIDKQIQPQHANMCRTSVFLFFISSTQLNELKTSVTLVKTQLIHANKKALGEIYNLQLGQLI